MNWTAREGSVNIIDNALANTRAIMNATISMSNMTDVFLRKSNILLLPVALTCEKVNTFANLYTVLRFIVSSGAQG